MIVEKVAYGGWPNCYRLANDQIELIVTSDVGPRVIRFGFIGGANEFNEFTHQLGKVGGDEWRLYGGHRLWNAPESMELTYVPDNGTIEVVQNEGSVIFRPPTEALTQIQKEIEIALSDEGQVTVTHRLWNRGSSPQELAPWALSVMAAGGTAIVALPPRGTHDENLLPSSRMVLWAYTDFTDPRWTWGKKYILLRQDASVQGSQKLGINNTEQWAAHANHGNLFVKLAAFQPEATYPDMGSSTEIYTEGGMLEVESLAPFSQVAPGVAAEHVERWYLFRDVPAPKNDDDVDQHVLPLVRSVL